MTVSLPLRSHGYHGRCAGRRSSRHLRRGQREQPASLEGSRESGSAEGYRSSEHRRFSVHPSRTVQTGALPGVPAAGPIRFREKKTRQLRDSSSTIFPWISASAATSSKTIWSWPASSREVLKGYIENGRSTPGAPSPTTDSGSGIRLDGWMKKTEGRLRFINKIVKSLNHPENLLHSSFHIFHGLPGLHGFFKACHCA